MAPNQSHLQWIQRSYWMVDIQQELVRKIKASTYSFRSYIFMLIGKQKHLGGFIMTIPIFSSDIPAPSVLPVVLQSASSDRPVATDRRPHKLVITHTAVDGRNPANQLIDSFSHYLQGLIHLRWYKISAINSITRLPPWMLGFSTTKCREIYQSHGWSG